MSLFIGQNLRVQTITASTILTGTEDVILANCATGSITITLPSAVSFPGKIIEITKTETSANNMVISGSQLINGMSSLTLNQAYSPLRLKSTGSAWIAEWNPIQKQYSLSLTSAQTGFAITRAVGIPYQSIDGTWRLRGNIWVAITAATSFNFSIQGIAWMTTQSASCMAASGFYANAYAPTGGGNQINLSAGSAVANWELSFDMELTSKPTFAE